GLVQRYRVRHLSADVGHLDLRERERLLGSELRVPVGATALLLWVGDGANSKTQLMMSPRYPLSRPAPRSAFAGYRFPPEVITLAVRWYLRFGLSYRDVEELLAERGLRVVPGSI